MKRRIGLTLTLVLVTITLYLWPTAKPPAVAMAAAPVTSVLTAKTVSASTGYCDSAHEACWYAWRQDWKNSCVAMGGEEYNYNYNGCNCQSWRLYSQCMSAHGCSGTSWAFMLEVAPESSQCFTPQ